VRSFRIHETLVHETLSTKLCPRNSVHETLSTKLCPRNSPIFLSLGFIGLFCRHDRHRRLLQSVPWRCHSPPFLGVGCFVYRTSLRIPQTSRRGTYPSSGRCLLPVNLPFFLIFLREHSGRERCGGIASYQMTKRVLS